MNRLVCLICMMGLVISMKGQSICLGIAVDKTSSLVFPFPVLHVDRGSKDLLVEKVRQADNILLIKAARKNFTETSLSVVTGDGSVYAFTLNFDPDPNDLVYNLSAGSHIPLSTYANSILNNQRTVHGVNARKWDMTAHLIGIYIRENVLYYQFCLNNRGTLDYDIDLLRFFIRDKKKASRTSEQEIELKPLYIAGNYKRVVAGHRNVLVVALDKYTIPDAKYMGVEILEKNGGRHLHLKIGNKKIIRARPLYDLK